MNLAGILELLGRVEPASRVVWNSNMYFNPRAGELLRGLADIYLADFKCGNRRCSRDLLNAEDYVEVVRRNLTAVREHADVIVRHVVLPGHRDCCLRPILEWLAREMGGVKVSLRGDYIPPAAAGKSPRKYPSAAEMQEATALAEKLGLRLVK